jgi:hypothetical protein
MLEDEILTVAVVELDSVTNLATSQWHEEWWIKNGVPLTNLPIFIGEDTNKVL